MTVATNGLSIEDVNWELINRLNKDLKEGASLLSREEARYLVDLYYQVQDIRKRAASQGLQQGGANEPHALVSWLFDQFRILENDVKKALGAYANSKTAGRWAQSIHGIGPVISAGLLAHIDVNPWKCYAPKGTDRCSKDAPHQELGCEEKIIATAGGVWRFAGLDPTVKWDKGAKRPWNARLKRLSWIIGDCFVKVHNSEKDIYGHVYKERKMLEVSRNEAGNFSAQAEASLKDRNIKDKGLKECYESGRLPDGRIELRARRYAVKLFLSHYHHVAYEDHFGKAPPSPYIIEHGGHSHFIAPPNWPM